MPEWLPHNLASRMRLNRFQCRFPAIFSIALLSYFSILVSNFHLNGIVELALETLQNKEVIILKLPVLLHHHLYLE